MTRSELRTLVLGWLDDSEAGYFTESTVNTWLNLAQREVQKEMLAAGENYYLKAVETSTVADQADYAMPDDFYKIHRLEIILSGTGVDENRRRLNPTTLNQQYLYGNGSGTSEAYVLKKNRVTLFPTPDSAKTLRLWYSYRVANMASDSSDPDVPEEYHEYVAVVAALNGFIKDDRAPQVLIIKQQQYRELMKQSAEDRTQDQSRMVIESDHDYGAFF